MIVLDSSAILDGYFLPECWQPLVSLIKTETILVPQHFMTECISGLRRIDRHQNLSDFEVETFGFFLGQLPIIVVPALALMTSVWAKRHNMTAYDASYVAIAQSEDATLITHDEKLATAASNIVKTLRLDTAVA